MPPETADSQSDAILAVFSQLSDLILPAFALMVFVSVLPMLLRLIIESSEHSGNGSSTEKVRLKASRVIKEMIQSVEGDTEPKWLEKLVRYEKQPIEDKKIKSAVEQMEKALEKEYERFKENHKEFKKLVMRTDGNYADIAENPDDNPVLMNLAVGLAKQKQLVLKIAEETLEMRIQEDTATRTKKANELAEKMGKELDATKETEKVRKTARSVHEEVLHEILASKEATDEMKERAEAMLPHFKSVSPEEEQTEMKRQDFELDLQTLEKIKAGSLELEEKEPA